MLQKKLIFVGPSLKGSEPLHEFDGDVRPPVACGDVYRGVSEGATCIGIIDGVFELERAVWHKEILWALSMGITVFGASSMGALRAVELEPFGMVGVGRIFEWYRDGAIDDDGEVAVLHSPAELGFRALTEPLVNVRASLMRAKAASLLTEHETKAILSAARSIHYKERTQHAVFECLKTTIGTSSSEAAANSIREKAVWLDAHWVDQKYLDAIELVNALSEYSGPDKTESSKFAFHETVFWRNFVRALKTEKV